MPNSICRGGRDDRPAVPPKRDIASGSSKTRGRSLRQIARVLNAEGVPTPMRQAEWDKSHVWRVPGTLYMQELEKASIARLPTGEALPPVRLQHQ